MEESQESIIAEPVTTPEPQRGFTKAFVPLITSAALLFGGVSEAHSAGHSVDSSDQTSDHVLNLSQQELSEIQKTKLPYHLTVPQIANGENNINSGFNTQHLGFDSESIGYAKMTEFKKQIDFISENHQTEVRFGIPRWEVASLTPDKAHVQWNEEQLKYFKEASVYAQSKGLEIYFVVTPPEVPDDFDFDSYLNITKEYYTRIAQEFTGVILQPGNEYDVHNVKNYGTFDHEISDEQMKLYERWLEAATSAIHKVNPSIQITQSLSGYPMNIQTIEKWKKIDGSIGKYVDIYSLDTYPTSVENAKELPFLVNLFKDYLKEQGKDISVVAAEVGMPTTEGVYTEEQQKEVLTAAIDAYKKDGIKVLPYQLKDEPNQKKEKSIFERIEENFGIFRRDGSKKAAADRVIDALKKENP
jgi:hypothetical protein